VGPDVAGGNDAGLVDSRCIQSGTGVQTCNAQNAWAAATDCGQDAGCFIGKQRTCGQCPFNVFSPGACTETFLRSQFFQATCPQFGLGVSQQCGSSSDCCSTACNATGPGFAFCAPNDFSPCLSGSFAIELDNAALPLRVPGTTLLGDDTFQPTCGFGVTPDTAYTFTAPAASTYVFDTFGSNIDTVLSVKDVLACNEIACNDDSFGSFASRVVMSLATGQRVLVVVDGRGDYTLNVADVGAAGCGNGIIDDFNEQCDGSDFGGQDCFNMTFGSLPFGTLSCTPGCTIDTSNCTSGGFDGGIGGFGGGFGGFGAFGAGPSAGGRVGAGGIIIGPPPLAGAGGIIIKPPPPAGAGGTIIGPPPIPVPSP